MPSKLKLLLVVVVLASLASLTACARTAGRAEQDFLSQLAERLEAHGLPVNAITVNTQPPLDITIQLQSESSGDTLLSDDIEHLRLAEREIGELYLAVGRALPHAHPAGRHAAA